MPVQVPNPHLQNSEVFCEAGHSILQDSCRSCKRLKKEWYSYLTNTGFDDIEKGLRLAQPTEELGLRIDFQTQITFNAKLDYYLWTEQCLTNCSFETMVDRIIWQYHTEGYSSREIAPIVGFSQPWIVRKLKKIESSFKKK